MRPVINIARLAKTKILLLAALLLCTCMAQATSYNYLVFTNTSGTTTAFNLTNLSFVVNGNNLQLTNTRGTFSLVLTDLQSMQFSESDDLTAVEDVLLSDQPVQVYSISGTTFGSFSSLTEAASRLAPGVYVISNGSATQTIVVK